MVCHQTATAEPVVTAAAMQGEAKININRKDGDNSKYMKIIFLLGIRPSSAVLRRTVINLTKDSVSFIASVTVFITICTATMQKCQYDSKESRGNRPNERKFTLPRPGVVAEPP